MRALTAWQAALTRTIDGGTSADLARYATRPVPGPSLEQGCRIYRSTSQGARIATLSDVFPVCSQVLGEHSFQGLAREFVRRVPSVQGDLNRFGAQFSAFVADAVAQQPVFAELAWLPDLAHLEWLCHALYYSADTPPPDTTPLQYLDATKVFPRPAATVGWLYSAWPVDQIWAAHQAAAEPAAMQVAAGEHYLVVERRAFRSQVAAVDGALWRLLDACGSGLSLAQMAEDPELPVERLAELIGRGWLGGLESDDDAIRR